MSVFPGGIGNGMNGMGSICSGFRPEGSRYLLLHFEFPDSSFGCVIVWRDGRVLKEFEHVVSPFDQTPFEFVELFPQMVEISFEQFVKSLEPTLR